MQRTLKSIYALATVLDGLLKCFWTLATSTASRPILFSRVHISAPRSRSSKVPFSWLLDLESGVLAVHRNSRSNRVVQYGSAFAASAGFNIHFACRTSLCDSGLILHRSSCSALSQRSQQTHRPRAGSQRQRITCATLAARQERGI